MENCLVRLTGLILTRISKGSKCCEIFTARKYTTSKRQSRKKHVYENIHPWKSLDEFSTSLLDNHLLYCHDGLVALNKPYGISGRTVFDKDGSKLKSENDIPNSVNYTLTDAIPHIKRTLGYSSLEPIKIPEKYTSGVALFAVNEEIKQKVMKCFREAQSIKVIPRTYWVVTRYMPKEQEGHKHLAMKLQRSPCKTYTVPVIINNWTHMEQKRRDIKILNVDFKVLSNSTQNLSTLLQIKTSTTKWHALRLFAATTLNSPILGDRIRGSLIQEVMGSRVKISPFVDAAHRPPSIKAEILELLSLSSKEQLIIPAHIHLRKLYLPSYYGRYDGLTLTAPLMPEFEWTCEKLQFKLPKEEDQIPKDGAEIAL
ncbi:mitochondrial mRNA pseudouridine synthase RPUSD3 [Cephus cinctus]|uniref:Pseudouridylate synthase RPUSD4, mitochondrial n=1 Tax=Cephus cinctus TaxID=211228 RepID=A0AAJ7C3I1_CEPCN|nr:mitochondrial mRNA pseudouridine synthase RPUSD3 [Cephus cinctus]